MFSAFKKFGRMGGGSSIPWTPTKLFAAGEKGGLWDFSTLANLYQDSVGTTPCTAVGQPIGLVLDTKNGTPQLGPELVTNGDFSNGATGWTLDTGWSVSGGAVVGSGMNDFQIAQNINSVANKTYQVVFTLTRSAGSVRVSVGKQYDAAYGAFSASGTYTVFRLGRADSTSLYFYPESSFTGSIDNISVREIPGNHLTQSTSTKRPTLGRMPATGVRNLLVNTATLSTQNVTTVAGSYTIQFTGAGSVTASGTYSGALTNGQTFTCTAGTLTLTVSGSVTNAQLEAGSTATAKQVVGAAYDITESGVASVYTAYFDGVDDCLVSPSIDFTATDKMSVFAGARKLDDSTAQDLIGLSSTIAVSGGFSIGAPGGGGLPIYGVGFQGTDFGYVNVSNYAAPTSNVLCILLDLSKSGVLNECNYIVDGVQPTIYSNSSNDAGGGTFGNYPFYIGQRGASSYTYKGFLSALCTRGAATDATTVTSMEQWTAARTPGVTLP